MTQTPKRLCCHSQLYLPPRQQTPKCISTLAVGICLSTALLYKGKVTDALSRGSLIIFIYSGTVLLPALKKQSCLSKCISQSSLTTKEQWTAGDGGRICHLETWRKEGAVISVAQVASYEVRARWMNTVRYLGALNMQRGDMLDIWSWSKVILICRMDTQLAKCPQQQEGL